MPKKKVGGKRPKGKKIDPDQLPFAYNMRTDMFEEQRFIHTAHGPKIVSGYVSIEEFSKLSCPILTKFPYFVCILKAFEQGMDGSSAPISELITFLRHQICINQEVRNLQEFVDKPLQLIDAISETNFLEVSDPSEKGDYEIRKRKC